MACTIPRAFLHPQKISAVHSGSSRRGENSPRSSTTATRNMRPMLPPLSERIKSRKSVVLPEPGFPHSKKPESNFSPNTSVITRLHPGTSRAMRITIELIFPAERDSASSEREWAQMPARCPPGSVRKPFLSSSSWVYTLPSHNRHSSAFISSSRYNTLSTVGRSRMPPSRQGKNILPEQVSAHARPFRIRISCKSRKTYAGK